MPIAASRWLAPSASSGRRGSIMAAASRWWTIQPRSPASCWADPQGTRNMDPENDNAQPAPTVEEGQPMAPRPDVEARLGDVEAELAEAKDRLLRALAETEHVRCLAERERSDAGRCGAANFAKDVLNVADN